MLPRISVLLLLSACAGSDDAATTTSGDDDDESADTGVDTTGSDTSDTDTTDTDPGSTDTGAASAYQDPTPLPVLVEPFIVEPYGDPADVYRPDATGTFPLIVWMQGADVGREHYEVIATYLAERGYVVVVPDHERDVLLLSGLYPEVGLIDATVDSVRADPTLSAVATPGPFGVAGHSLGGAASLEAVGNVCSSFLCTSGSYTRPDDLAAVVGYGANRKPPIGSVPSTDNAGVPILLTQGAEDGAADADDTLETWEKLSSGPKSWLLMAGGNHYSVTDEQNPPGAMPDRSPANVPQEVGLEVLGRWMGRYFDAYVKGDASALDLFPAGTTTPETGVTLGTEL